jgi:hypothetical protein
MRPLLLTLSLAIQLSAATIWTGSGTPSIPASYPKRMFPQVPLVTGTVRTVCASGCDHTTVQAAWNAASYGDAIEVEAGETFTSASTILNMTVKAGSGWITIRSSAYASLPAFGNKATSANAADMPKLVVTSNNTDVIKNDYTNGTVADRKVHNVYFLGIEVTLGAAVTSNYSPIAISDGGGGAAGSPDQIIFDRCWIHPHHLASGSDLFVRGILIGGASNWAVINSTVENWAMVNAGDSQAIGVLGGPGPCLVRNNYLDAATEIILTGGSNTGAVDNQLSDCEFAFNHFKKRTEYTSGYDAKNCIEFKVGVRMWFHDNLIENCYNSSNQVGSCLLVTIRPSQSGLNNTTSDVIFENNVCRGAGQGVQISGYDEYCGNGLSSIVNTSGTSVTIVSGSQFGYPNQGAAGSLSLTINGTAYQTVTYTGVTSTTTATLSSSAGTQTGVYMRSTYACPQQRRILIRNNLFENISTDYNIDSGNLNGMYTMWDTTYINNTQTLGVQSGNTIGYYYANLLKPSITNLDQQRNIIVTNLYGSFADSDANNPDVFLVPPNTNGYIKLNYNLIAGVGGTELTDWNTVGTGNLAPADQTAIGLLTNKKGLDPSSTYYSSGAGANLACFDEDAITDGTPPSTTCANTIR